MDPLEDPALLGIKEQDEELATRLESLQKMREIAEKRGDEASMGMTEHALGSLLFYLERSGIGRSIEMEN